MVKQNIQFDGSPVENWLYPCLCAVTRKAGRIITKKYDEYLKPCGLKITQLSMLARISGNPGIAISELGKLLAMDQTTVSRNLQVLEKEGYIRLYPEPEDQRIKRIQLTETGLSKMREARPLWDKAQLEMEQVLGRGTIEELLRTFKKIV